MMLCRFIAILTICLSPIIAFSDELLTEEENFNKTIIEQWEQVVNGGSLELLDSIVAENYTLHEPNSDRELTLEAYKTEIESYRALGLLTTIQDKTYNGDLVWMRWSSVLRMPSANEDSIGRGVHIHKIKDGKINETWMIANMSGGPWRDSNFSPVSVQRPEPIWDEAVGGVDTVFLEDMTAGEISAAIRNGFTSVIVATGGIEQNGPNVATGKHNVVLRATADAIARKHGKMLVSSIVQFVPEGQIDPPTGHMNFPGTISLTQETFEALLTDISSSLRQHGFKQIFLIGESGGNGRGMENVAQALSLKWAGEGIHIAHIPEYYSQDMWSFDYLKEIGYKQLPDEATAFRNNIHTDLHYESIMAVVDPSSVRAQTRFANGGYVVHGVKISSEEELIELGRKLVDYRTNITIEAMNGSVEKK